MKCRLLVRVGLCLLSLFAPTTLCQLSAQDDITLTVNKAITAAGGREKLLTTFRMVKRYNSGTVRASAEKSQNRTSVLQAPKIWRVGGKERDGEPAKFVVWAWTLGILTDAETKLASIPGISEGDATTIGVQASGTVSPAMDLHFHPQTLRLIRVDWRDDIYRFSNWREHDGAGFHALTVMHRRQTDKPWFFHEIVSVERLSELPQ